MAILVTGGAGYIGSHVVRQLSEAGETVIVLDDLSTGFKDSLLHQEQLYQGSVGDSQLLEKIFTQNQIEGVLHFAASIVVPESVTDPLKYYKNNSLNTLSLIEACVKNKIAHFIFSSTAAVYGMPESGVASEKTPLNPVNPYGHSKLVSEFVLNDVSQAYPLNYVALRYFNAAGADPLSRIGQRTPKATHLIKIACETATGHRDFLEVFGNNYPTPDGTCLRDYVHVEDLASAHLLALKYLRQGGKSVALNVGYGKAASVLEVIAAIEQVSGQKLKTKISQSRAGDPPQLIAESAKIRELLGWKPKFASLQKNRPRCFSLGEKTLEKIKIPFNRPYLTGDELSLIGEALSDRHLVGDGRFTKSCHKWLESHLKVPKALLTPSCTDALEMAALLLDIKPGDEIIMPSFTFVSTANPFVLRGGVPVFVDIPPGYP